MRMKGICSATTLLMALSSLLCNHSGAEPPPPIEQLPARQWTSPQRERYEERVQWFFDAQYGVMFHFVPNMHRFSTGRIEWDRQRWNRWVDAVDVEAVASQADEIGAGYVILSIGQGGGFYCAPNPVIRRHWGLETGEAESRRDLPMDLYEALSKRGIRLMLYSACTPYLLPGPASEVAGWYGSGHKFRECTPEGAKHWIEALQWYSDHYGRRISGWWLDGLREWAPGYRQAVTVAIRHGHLDTLVTSGTHALSDFLHGHCVGNWEKQQQRLPTTWRWDETHRIQWHAFQYLGRSWGARGTAHSTASIVDYARKVIESGGVITFDIGTFDEAPAIDGPYLSIPGEQMEQLRAVRDALEELR